MPKNPSTRRGIAPLRARNAVATMLLFLLAVLIVRDIPARRWGTAVQATTDVTQRAR